MTNLKVVHPFRCLLLMLESFG